MMKFTVSIFTLFFYLLCFNHSSSEAKVFSSYSSTGPALLTSLKDNKNQLLRIFDRAKRQSSDNTVSPSIRSVESKLGNETSHNQALIHWSGNYSSVIFILTRRKDSSDSGTVTQSVLWRSHDYGKTYVDQSSKFDANISLKSYFTCPNNRSKVVFIDSYKAPPVWSRVWVSEDEGVTYTVTNVTFNLDKILFHPAKQDVMLGYDKEDAVLYASVDLGRSWTRLQEGVTADRYFWYKEGLDDDDVVFMEYQDHTAFDRPFFFVKSCRVPNCSLNNFQRACSVLGPIEEKSLLVQDEYVFVQKSGALEKLYVSYRRQPFMKARFYGSGEQTDIHVISSHSNTVVVGVNHDDGVTNLYFSDERGHEFALSLEDVRYFNKKTGSDRIFTVDMHEVKGVKGAYLANKRMLGFLNQTMITWDNGRTWHYLSVPHENKGKCVGCLLNLHCAMSGTKSGYFMPAMLSKESAPGLIIAHGSVGKSLADSPTLVSVYVSNDTGRTWRPAMRGRYLFVMADHGSVIVAVSMHFLRPILNLSLSNDFGVTWKGFPFSQNRIFVDGILTEPGENTHYFTLFGHNNHQGPWKVFSIDVSPVIHRNCSHPHDFVNVSLPFNGVLGCHLGMNRQVEVARPGCLLGRSYHRPTSTQVCNCTDDDYECGFEYSPGPDGTCRKLFPQIDWISDVISDDGFYSSNPPCIDGFRNVSKYRKIPGDVCIHEVPRKLMVRVPCHTWPASPTSTPAPLPTTSSTTTSTPHVPSGLSVKGGKRYGLVKTTMVVTARQAVKWKVTFMNSTSIKVTHLLVPSKTSLNIVPLVVGSYLIQASNLKAPFSSQTIILEFYYPISNMSLLHPPVVSRGQTFNLTSYVCGPNGLPGIFTLVGPVKYEWMVNGKVVKASNWGDNMLTYKWNSSPGMVPFSVVATNKVGQTGANTFILVAEYLLAATVPILPSFPLNTSLLTYDWLRDVDQLLTIQLLKIKELRDILIKHDLNYGLDFHIYIAPQLPLEGTLLLSSHQFSQHPRDDLESAMTDIRNVIDQSGLILNLTRDRYLLVSPHPSKGSSAVLISLLVLLVVGLIVGILLALRKYGRSRRWKSYFGGRRGAPSFRFFTRRRHDQQPIVDDEDHYIDEELEDLDTSDAPHDGTLQFQT